MERKYFLYLLASGAFFFAFSANIFATNYTSNASGTGDWDTNADWSGSAPPNFGINNDNITISSSDSIVRAGSLDFNNGVTLIVNGILTVTSDFIANNNLDITVNGKLYILGSITAKNGAGLNITGTGSMDISGNASFGNNGAISIALGGSVNIDGSLTMGTNGTITGDGTISIGAGDGCQYVDPSSGISCSDPTTLPVEFVDVSAEANNNGGVDVKWATISEENNDFFTIERSLNGIDFQPIGQVKGQGSSDIRTNYSFVDNAPLLGAAYYRVRQTDFDGASEYSKTVKVANTYAGMAQGQIGAYPNPSTGGTFTLTGNGYAPFEEVAISLAHASGQKTACIKTSANAAGQFEIGVGTEKMLPGLYIFSVEGNNGPTYSRVIVK